MLSWSQKSAGYQRRLGWIRVQQRAQCILGNTHEYWAPIIIDIWVTWQDKALGSTQPHLHNRHVVHSVAFINRMVLMIFPEDILRQILCWHYNPIHFNYEPTHQNSHWLLARKKWFWTIRYHIIIPITFQIPDSWCNSSILQVGCKLIGSAGNIQLRSRIQ